MDDVEPGRPDQNAFVESFNGTSREECLDEHWFGRSHVDRDPDGDGETVAFPIRLLGQYEDAETGLHYNRYRYYSPGLGRYVSADPIGQMGGLNAYEYGDSQPTNMIDRLGLEPCSCDSSGPPRSFSDSFWSHYQFNREATRNVVHGVPYKGIKIAAGYFVGRNVARTFGLASTRDALRALRGRATTAGRYGPRIVLPGISAAAGFTRTTAVGSAIARWTAKTAIVIGTFELGIELGAASDALVRTTMEHMSRRECTSDGHRTSPRSESAEARR